MSSQDRLLKSQGFGKGRQAAVRIAQAMFPKEEPGWLIEQESLSTPPRLPPPTPTPKKNHQTQDADKNSFMLFQ